MTARSLTRKLWDGVRMRRTTASPDADARDSEARARPVTLPAAWPDSAAEALAALAPPGGPADLATLAERWLAPLADRAGFSRAAGAHALLLRQHGAPAAPAWSGEPGPRGYVLNLEHADSSAELAEAARAGRAVAATLWPETPPRITLTGLAGLLAARGLAYDSDPARAEAAALIAALRSALPDTRLCVAAPGPIDALLAVETSGIAPAFSPLADSGALSRASLAFLAARGLGPAGALAAELAGEKMFPAASMEAHLAMDAALRPLLDEMPARPSPLPAAPPLPRRRDLPARRGGTAQKALVGGQRVFLRTGEYGDGSLGEVAIALPQGSPAVRALVECLSHVIGTALQHGAPVGEILDAMAGTRFGAAGAVEGDPAVGRAASPLDYVARHLAHHYAPDAVLPPVADDGDDAAPLLPLELSGDTAPPRRRGLRVVK